jgi:epoxyqueuosine reductase
MSGDPSAPDGAPEATIEAALEARARQEGFSLFGIVRAESTEHMPFYRDWLDRGRHGGMGYLAREDSIARRADLSLTMEDVRSVVVVGHEYYHADDDERVGDPSLGIIARYARGDDYHDVIGKKLRALLRWLDGHVPGGARGRPYVDTGPILERDLARRAGLGWFGRNTMLIHPRLGSYFFLGLLLVDVALRPSEPFEEDRCGSCRACLDACPTGALLGRDERGAPVIDAPRCISYLTIEHRGPIPEELRPLMGNRIYGCDICQEVCPWNERFARPAEEPRYSARPATDGPALVDLMRMSEEDWRARTRGSAMRRAGYSGLRRNVAIALGNWLSGSDVPDPEAIGVLTAALSDEDPVVAEAARWGLGRAVGSHGSRPGDAPPGRA